MKKEKKAREILAKKTRDKFGLEISGDILSYQNKTLKFVEDRLNK